MKVLIASFDAAGLIVGVGIGSAKPAEIDATDDKVVVLAGTLEGASGSPELVAAKSLSTGKSQPKGGNVTLYAWPAESVLAAADTGEAVKLTPISKSKVAADGTFEFTVAAGTDLERFAGGTDYLNVTLSGTAGGNEYWYSSSIAADTAPAPTASAKSATNDTVAPAPGDLEIAPFGADNSQASTADQYIEKACYTQTAATYAQKTAQVGYTANARSGGTAKFTFSSGASSKFGVGVSSTGNYGTFSASGTSSMTTTSTIGFATNTGGAKAHRVYLVPKKYKIYCESNSGVPISQKYELRPASYTGGASTVASTTFSTNAYCTPIGKGINSTLDSSTATTMTLGYKVSTIIGIDLSAQSGCNSKTKITLNPGTSAGQICGEKGYPAASPGGVKLK